MRLMRQMGAMITLMAMVMVMVAWGPPAQAQTVAGGITYGTFSGIPATIAESSTTNAVSGAVLVRQSRGMGLFATFTVATNSIGSITVSYNVSLDGTNYSSTRPIRWVIDSTLTNSTGVVIAYTNVPATYLGNVRYLKTASVVNAATNALSAVSLQYSYSNSASP